MINKDMTIGDVISKHPETIAIFKKFGLDCNECQMASLEDLEHGAGVHRVNLDALLKEINQLLEQG